MTSCIVLRVNYDESFMIHLYFHLLILYILYHGQCMIFLLLFSVQEECWSPGAASGGGQLHQAGAAVGWGLERISKAWVEGWLHLQDQEMARFRSTRKSYPKMRALQQLIGLIGNDSIWRGS